MIPTISRKALQNLINLKGKYILIDVRTKDELEYGMIPTAKNIPLDELEEAIKLSDEEFQEKYKFKKFTKEDNIILHCRSGGRSERAAELLINKGYKNVKNYQGSILDWAEIDPNVQKY